MINIVFRRNTQVRLKGLVSKPTGLNGSRGFYSSPPSIFILNTIYNEGKCSNFEYLPFLFVFEWLVFLAIEMIGHRDWKGIWLVQYT